jgi:hypothetical protein
MSSIAWCENPRQEISLNGGQPQVEISLRRPEHTYQLVRLRQWAISRSELGIASAIATILQRRGGAR